MIEEVLERYEPVIGLEVHTHLATESKLFSPAPVAYGNAPNHDVHVIDLGLPGVLPVLNERVVELAIRLGLAIHATVNLRSVFARKNYFYPDLPKGYQISQFEDPVVSDGWIDIAVDEGKGAGDPSEGVRRIGITRAHLEEDAGKSIHDDAVTRGKGTHVDLNRSGVPLLEIVSEPDLRSAAEAGAYLRALRSLLRHIGVSEADMEKGQFRCDANVSLRPVGTDPFGTRTELKNLNSFRFVESAIEAEIVRQAELLDEGEAIVQATMAFDPETHRTRVLRVKENSDDYRYFPDPDLIPIEIAAEEVDRVRSNMPELPDVKRHRFIESYGLGEYDARLLTESRSVADFFERVVELRGTSHGKEIANWILRDLLQALKERELEIEESAMTPENLSALLGLVAEGRLTAKSARELFAVLVEDGGEPETLMSERGLEAVSDPGAIEGAVQEAIDGNPKAVESYRDGDAKSLNFLMGQVMKKTQGKANPATVRQLLAQKLDA
ncbi:MAG: Asp-tRNA(Asn)/Glu-tRNA(Gln) amidotransferase subunit GatB [Myxococcota bacterium]|nr:Asp-tRNA(Asn)/Glu-tRNA(Gln) amidotransferase subunit GatB [Myxococcota bacterium]